MFKRTVSEDDLRELKNARDAAARRYVEALTALDSAQQPKPGIPDPPPGPDEYQITRLNETWRILRPERRPASGWRARMSALVERIAEPILRRQQDFNSALVDHINRSVVVGRETRRSVDTVIELAREQFDALVTFERRLILFLQQLTPYIDAADREVAGLMRRINEDNAELADVLDHRTVALGATLGAGLSSVSDELLKRWESMVAREQRYEARVSALTAAHEELRTIVDVLNQASSTLKRELERVWSSAAVEGRGRRGRRGVPSSRAGAASPEPAERPPRLALDSHKYVSFEDRFRGSQDEIRQRVAEYLPYFVGASDVLDVGCGRGEFLEVLRENGIPARGIDLNPAMVEVCRTRGLAVEEADAVSQLASLPDGSLGGLFAAQVVEHFEPDYLVRFVDLACQKLRAGSTIVLETINPACWIAFFESYIRDITHVRPLHPDTLTYLLAASGFQHVEVRYRAPYPDRDKLQGMPVAPERATLESSSGRGGDGADGHGLAGGDLRLLADLVEAFNANVEKINRLLFTHLDYAAIGRRLPAPRA